MNALGPAGFPMRMPTVRIEPVEPRGSEQVICDELQWWFVVPQDGEVSAAAWYDRATSELMSVRETASPVAAISASAGEKDIEIDEWQRPAHGSRDWTSRRISLTARLGPETAEFLSVTMDGTRSDTDDAAFAGNWGGTRSRRIRDGGRLVETGPRTYEARRDDGAWADLVELSVGASTFRCLRVLDVEPGAEPSEIGQPLIDLDSCRTVAYWQYRPSGWDADAAEWLTSHPGDGLLIDGTDYQRRNCTGRDELVLTAFALASSRRVAEARQNDGRSTTIGR